MVSKRASAEEQKWQAENDAQTMVRYQEIMNDKSRMQRAINIAKQQASDLSRRASLMQNVAKSGAGSVKSGASVRRSGRGK